MSRKAYPSDLTDAQWAMIAHQIPLARPGGRPRRHRERELVNAIRYVVRSGCPWRYLPEGFPPWETAYAYFRHWQRDGTWERLHDTLRRQVRVAAGRDPEPSATILDSQTAKTTEKGGPEAMTAARR
jgi:putative transposase